jgi:hypothetical protein
MNQNFRDAWYHLRWAARHLRRGAGEELAPVARRVRRRLGDDPEPEPSRVERVRAGARRAPTVARRAGARVRGRSAD